LKIPKKHCGPQKTTSRATWGPRDARLRPWYRACFDNSPSSIPHTCRSSARDAFQRKISGARGIWRIVL